MDMIEKVARAIAEEYSGVSDYDWTGFIGEARAAIAALREPIEVMIDEGDKAAEQSGSSASAIYDAMLAAALKSRLMPGS